MYTRFSYTGKANTCSILHAGGNFGVDGFLLYYTAFTPAICAGVADHAARTVASGARARNAEESLLVSHLPTAAAGATTGGGFTLCASRAAAGFADLMFSIGNLLFSAERSFFELDGNVFPQIGAALRASAAVRTIAAKQIAESEKFTKDVAEILEDRCVESPPSCGRAYASVAEPVVHFALLGVREHGIGLAALLEFFFRVRIVRIAVRMELQRELAIGALYLLISGPTLHTQNFVVISFYARQGSLFGAFRLCLESGS